MSIRQVKDLEVPTVLENEYDVAIFASGYEGRCTFFPSKCIKKKISTAFLLGFEDLAESMERKRHDKYFKDNWGLIPDVANSSDDFVIQNILTNLVKQKGQIKNLLVDCSSMSRLWYAGIVNWARFGNAGHDTIIDFVYSLGKYEDQNLPMIIEDMFSIPGCEGAGKRLQHSVAIFGLGFGGWAALSVLERLEADEVVAFLAAPGASPDYPDRVRTLNKDFLDEPGVVKRILELPLRSVENCYRLLSELVSPHRYADSVTIVPMGPKPHVLASILVSMRFPEVSCMRVGAKRAHPERVEPNGEILAVRVVVGGEVLPEKTVNKNMRL